MVHLKTCLLFICYKLLDVAYAQRYGTNLAPSAPEASNFIKRGFHASIVLGDYLYIDGGDIWQMVNGNFLYAPNNQTLSIDLTKSWTNSTVTFNAINKTVTAWNKEYLWPDQSNSSFYQWGGEWSHFHFNQSTPPSALYNFQPDGRGGGEWREQGQTSTSIFNTLRRGFAGATASRGDTWYEIGGLTNCYSNPDKSDCGGDDILGPIISYNSTSNLWANDSARGFTSSGSVVGGRMHNIPFKSADGLNVVFGGGIASPLDSSSFTYPSNLLDFRYIYLYDPVTETFYNQTATGTFIPEPHYDFCSVGIPGFNGSYDIFIYGGYNPSLSVDQMMRASDAVYVLSLPGFVWFKADISPIRTRHLPTCNVVGLGGSQMMVVGGLDLTEPNFGHTNTPDPWTNGINIFDLSAMRWKDTYEPKDVPYQSPSVVKDWYIKNGPYPKWDPGVENLFVKHEAISNFPEPSKSQSGKKPNTGAIAGGATGGVAFLVVIIAAVCYILRSRRRRRLQGQVGEDRKELDASIPIGSMQRLKHMLKQELKGSPFPELSSREQLPELLSNELHEVGTASARERHEMSAVT